MLLKHFQNSCSVQNNYFQFQVWFHVKYNTEIILNLFQAFQKWFQCFISHVTTADGYMWNKTLKKFQKYFKIILFHM